MSKDHSPFNNDVSRLIWESKYRYQPSSRNDQEQSIRQSWLRVASCLAQAEQKQTAFWQEQFYSILEDFHFLPGGRILAGSGVTEQLTLFNCFVMGEIEDSIDGIFDALKESALTMQQGGGIGCDFSNLRPQGSSAKRVGSIASGPVSFMRIWDSMCATLLSTGTRRGAMMATLRCDHPDIEQFISVKQDRHELRHFNLSVLVSDAFMQAVENNGDWSLVFPVRHLANADTAHIVQRHWHSPTEPENCQVLKVLKARELWDKLTRASYDYAEPGVLFIDRINLMNNLHDIEHISATNPCGEIPLPAYGACNLGSINLSQFVRAAFTPQASLDLEALSQTASIATRMLDNIIEASRFPLRAQQYQALNTRRVGLGISGLADALMMLGLRYDSDAARYQAALAMQIICYTAYRTSIELAKEKGCFPLLNKSNYLSSAFIKTLPEDLQHGIAESGIRNSHLTAIAPTGTVSLLANNVSSGLEPVFDWQYQRQILNAEGHYETQTVTDYACRLWQDMFGKNSLPEQFITAQNISPMQHLKMQAALQPFVDNAISKTLNIPQDYDFEKFKDVYLQAYKMGLKGCTTFRPNAVTGSILTTTTDSSHCCGLERETD